ncbi:FliG C-terminal domain-containing protein [Jannaschia sp. KMU-145]|uniref:FliG C-terminal domain-containing protein n=1 Tax=Jannaschia halovivens TaxID=3388667 RepID=UPI00396B24B6
MSDLTPTLGADAPVRQLSPRQKAAVVIHLLVSGGVDPGIRELPAHQQRRLVSDLADLRFVDRPTLAAVVREFAGALDSIGLHFPRDPARIIAGFDGALSLEVVEAMTAELGDNLVVGDATWAKLAAQPDADIAELLTEESDEICAIVLSKLVPERAARLLGQMDETRANGVTAAFSRTGEIGPAALARIGLALGRQTCAAPARAFPTSPEARIGEILNAARSDLRRGLLDALDESDATFAGQVRASVFSFENVPQRLDPRDVPRALRTVPPDKLAAVVAGAPESQAPVVDFLLSNISTRLASQIREDAAERDDVQPEEAEAGMLAVIAAIREAEAAGELQLKPTDG